ncbi:hypothetical protein BH20ACT13_BH20ACT13_09340 [soil metagenome]
MTGLFDPSGSDAVLMFAAVATSAVWLAAAAVVLVRRRPTEPPVGPRTLDLGPEPPAVANFLVNDFRVTDDAVPATLIDLAARNVVDVEQRGPGVFYVPLRTGLEEPLDTYERRVFEHLSARAVTGVVPAEALTTGPGQQSTRWRRRFENEVVSDARRRGLSRDAIDGPVFTVLTLAAAVPALLVWTLSEFEAGIVAFGAGIGILGWIRARHPQRETAAGLAAASRWLGVRAELAENEVFPTHSPLTVELWDRLLAYGAALGVAGGASGPLPMGTESDTDAWSAYGGRWRPVRVVYPRLWPPAWGLDPLVAIVAGIGAALAGALALYWLGPALFDAGIFGALLVVPCAAVVVGISLAVLAYADLRSTVEVTGPILRLRVFGGEKRARCYLAVDDGESATVLAWRLNPRQYLGLTQGETVTVATTRSLACVRWIVREQDQE